MDSLGRRFSACVFDFDGVLVDSEPLHAEAKRRTLDHFRIRYPPQLFTEFKGRPDIDFFDYVAAELAGGAFTAEELGEFKKRLYLEMFEQVPLVAGVAAFLAQARAAFPRLGLATSATDHDFSLAAEKYQLRQWFDVIVTGDDTTRHKPDPEPYLKAMAALGAAGPETLAIEDSPNGVRSAKAAGCVCAALASAFGPSELSAAGADLVVASFAELGRALDSGALERS